MSHRIFTAILGLMSCTVLAANDSLIPVIRIPVEVDIYRYKVDPIESPKVHGGFTELLLPVWGVSDEDFDPIKSEIWGAQVLPRPLKEMQAAYSFDEFYHAVRGFENLVWSHEDSETIAKRIIEKWMILYDDLPLTNSVRKKATLLFAGRLKNWFPLSYLKRVAQLDSAFGWSGEQVPRETNYFSKNLDVILLDLHRLEGEIENYKPERLIFVPDFLVEVEHIRTSLTGADIQCLDRIYEKWITAIVKQLKTDGKHFERENVNFMIAVFYRMFEKNTPPNIVENLIAHLKDETISQRFEFLKQFLHAKNIGDRFWSLAAGMLYAQRYEEPGRTDAIIQFIQEHTRGGLAYEYFRTFFEVDAALPFDAKFKSAIQSKIAEKQKIRAIHARQLYPRIIDSLIIPFIFALSLFVQSDLYEISPAALGVINVGFLIYGVRGINFWRNVFQGVSTGTYPAKKHLVVGIDIKALDQTRRSIATLKTMVKVAARMHCTATLGVMRNSHD